MLLLIFLYILKFQEILFSLIIKQNHHHVIHHNPLNFLLENLPYYHSIYTKILHLIFFISQTQIFLIIIILKHYAFFL